MDALHPEPAPPSPTRDERVASAATAALVALAVLAFGTAVTVMGPVLQPFLVALFLFYATQFGAKSLTRLGMQPWSAYPALIGLTLIFSILTAQFVYREADIFRTTWPRYEDRITGYLSAWWPSVAPQPQQSVAAVSDGDNATAKPSPRVPVEDGRESFMEPLPEQTADLLGSSSNDDDAATPTREPRAELGPITSSPTRGPILKKERTTYTDFFRITSQDVLDYVFSHGLHVAELFVVVFCYLVFLFLGSRKLKARVLRAFPGEQGRRLVAIGEGITESMERFMVVKTAAGVGMAVSAGMIMYLFDNTVLATLLSAMIVLNRIFWIDFFELRMSGKQLNLDPTLLFLWLSYWGWAWGILGLILAYPMLAAVRITLEHLGGLHGWALLLSDE